MTKLVLDPIANLQNESSVVTTLTKNNVATVNAMENTISRDGTLPNHMNADFDMNSNRIVNLPDATTPQEPATFSQLEEYVGAVGSGAVLQAEYITVSNDVILQNERALTEGHAINLVDGGAGSTLTIDVDSAVLDADTGTLTNKTIDLTDNTVTGTTSQFNTALSDNDFATLAGTETLTNKTVNLSSNTLTGTKAQFNTALSDDDFATLTGTETLTNKTLTSPVLTTPNLGAATATSLNVTGLTASQAVHTDASKNLVSVANTGTGNNVLATSPTLTTPNLGTPSAATLTNATGLPIATGVSGLGTGVATFLATPSSANLRSALTDESGTGAAYFQGGALGTPASGTLTNATGLPVSTGVSGLGAGVATFLATPSSANLRSALTDEVGTGSAYFTGGALGTPASATLTNATGLPLSGLNTQAAYTLVGNNSGSTASPTAVDIATVTQKVSPAATDLLLISDQAASGAWKRATVSSISSAGSVSSIAGNTGAFTLDRGITNSTNAIRIDVPVMYGWLGGLTISTSAGSATFGVSVGACADSTAVDFMKLTSAYTKTPNSWSLGTGGGSLDTGTASINNWYYVYIIKRLDTGVVDILISLSATSPTLPTNYTIFRRIGVLRFVGGPIWRDMLQYGDDFYYVTPVQDMNVSGTLTTSRTLQTLTAPPSMLAFIRTYMYNASSAASFLIQPPLETDRAVGAFMSLTAETANQGSAGHFEILTNSSSQIAIRAGQASGSGTIETLGWRDTRGK